MARPRDDRLPGWPAVLTELREEAGLTIVELAAETGISSSVLSCWERGETSPNLRGVEHMADYFGYEWELIKK